MNSTYCIPPFNNSITHIIELSKVTLYNKSIETCGNTSAKEPTQNDESTSPKQRLILLLPLIFLAIVTCSMNVLVMVCTRIYHQLRTVSSMYVFSLAIADTVVGFAVMGPMMVYTVNGMWPLGIDFCTVWVLFDFCW